jgi:hypothetical protein
MEKMRNFKNFLWLAMLLSPAWGMDKVNDKQSDSAWDGSDTLSRSSNAQNQEEEKSGPAQALPQEVRESIKVVAEMVRLVLSDEPSSLPEVAKWGEEVRKSFSSAMSEFESFEGEASVFSQMNSVGIAKQVLFDLSQTLIEVISLLLPEQEDSPLAVKKVVTSLMKKHLSLSQGYEAIRQDFQPRLEKYLVCLLLNDQEGADEVRPGLVNLLQSMEDSFPKCLQNSKSAGGHASFQQEKEQENFKCALEAYAQERSPYELSLEDVDNLHEFAWSTIMTIRLEDLSVEGERFTMLFPHPFLMSNEQLVMGQAEYEREYERMNNLSERTESFMEKVPLVIRDRQTDQFLVNFFEDLSTDHMIKCIDSLTVQLKSLKKKKNQERPQDSVNSRKILEDLSIDRMKRYIGSLTVQLKSLKKNNNQERPQDPVNSRHPRTQFTAELEDLD